MPVGVPAYVSLANITLSANAASVTFSSINQTYRHLVLVGIVTYDPGAGPMFMRVNGSASGIYQSVSMTGDGASPGSQVTGLVTALSLAANTNILGSTPANVVLDILDYTQTNKHKPVLCRINRPSFTVVATAGRIGSTDAITSFNLFSNSVFTTGTTFALYGVSA